MLRFDDIQGRNMLHKAVQQLTLIVAVVIVVSLMVQNHYAKVLAEQERCLHVYYHAKEIMTEDPVTHEIVGTDKYTYPGLNLPTRDTYHKYIWNCDEGKFVVSRLCRFLVRVTFVGTSDKHGWATDVVAGIADRRFWMLFTVIAAVIIWRICAKKTEKMKEELHDGQGTDIVVADYTKLCHKRVLYYIGILAFAMWLSAMTKHNVLWLILAAIVIIVAEIIYFYSFAARTDFYNTGEQKKHKVRNALFAALTWCQWGLLSSGVHESLREKYHVGRGVIKRVLSWPFARIKKAFQESREEYLSEFEEDDETDV